MTPFWRDRISLGFGLALACFLAVELAQGEFFWVSLAAAGALLVVAARVSPWPLPSTALWVLLAGYLLGNRGFAQIAPAASLPLFPAELTLLLAAPLLLWRWARTREPWADRSPLSLALLAWIFFGGARLVPDLPVHGLTAVRDFATFAYAGFFFLGFQAARCPTWPAAWLGLLRWGSLALLPLFLAFETFPTFFLDTLLWRGNPLLYYKADLVGTFLGLGAVVWFLDRPPRQRGPLLIALLLVAGVLLTRNRAALFGLTGAVTVLSLRGRSGLTRAVLIAGCLALGGLTVAVETGLTRWADTPVPALAERLRSFVDFSGERPALDESVESKGDNNRFRTVWWQAVIQETLTTSPVLGLGFGHDLSAGFLRAYYPDSWEEFTARSPHSIFITLFGRTGWLGLAGFLLILAAAAPLLRVHTQPDASVAGLVASLATLILLLSASFGVVLEGPMGASFFWSSLGLAHGLARPRRPAQASPEA